MKKLITISSLILVFSVLLSFNVSANAESTDTKKMESITGVIFPDDEEEKEYISSLTPEDWLRIQEKENQAVLLSSQTDTKASTATKISIPGTFTMYQQAENNYCVPACVKSVLQYANRSSASQASIASDLGTTSGGTTATQIAPYLNQKQSFYYARISNPSQSTMCDKLYATITGPKKPCLMGIINTSGSNWHYATNGHFLVVNAIYSDKSQIQFADPLGGTHTNWPYFYLKTANVSSSVCKEIIW